MALIVPLVMAAAAAASPQAAIEVAMADSAAGWNGGDLARFTAIYAADAIYVAGDKVARGKVAIAGSYEKSFVNGGNTRGRLSFQPLAWRPLSAVHVLHVARWTLAPAGGAAQTGLTTLLFERRKEGWKIVSDHSS